MRPDPGDGELSRFISMSGLGGGRPGDGTAKAARGQETGCLGCHIPTELARLDSRHAQ